MCVWRLPYVCKCARFSVINLLLLLLLPSECKGVYVHVRASTGTCVSKNTYLSMRLFACLRARNLRLDSFFPPHTHLLLFFVCIHAQMYMYLQAKQSCRLRVYKTQIRDGTHRCHKIKSMSCMRMRVSIDLACIHTYTFVHINMCVCVCTHTYIRIYIHTYIHTYIHNYMMHACLHTYMHTYIRSHTHTNEVEDVLCVSLAEPWASTRQTHLKPWHLKLQVTLCRPNMRACQHASNTSVRVSTLATSECMRARYQNMT